MFPAHPDSFNKRQNNRRRRAPIQTDPPFRPGTGHDKPGQSWGGPNAPWFRQGGPGKSGWYRDNRGRRGGISQNDFRRRYGKMDGSRYSGGGLKPHNRSHGRFFPGYGRRRTNVGGFRRPGSRGNYGAGNRNLGRYGGGRRDMDPIPRRPVAGGGGMGGMGGAPNPVAGGGQPGFDWRRWGAGRGGYQDHRFKKKFDAHEKKYGRGSWDNWKSDPSKSKYWKGQPNWITNSIAWGEGTEAPTWQDMGYKDQESFDKRWKLGKDGRSLHGHGPQWGQELLDVGYGTWWRGRGGTEAPPITAPGAPPITSPGMPAGGSGRPPRPPRVPRRSPRRRSRVPYNRRGYGRRFDRFRRGLGGRRPAPVRGGRGRPQPGGGRGRPMGFVNPYAIARRRGYKGSYADWMQTEDGRRYKEMTERGIMF